MLEGKKPEPEEEDKKYFDLAEANRLVGFVDGVSTDPENRFGYVGRIVDDLMNVYAEVIKARRAIERLELKKNSKSEQHRLESRYETKIDELRILVDELDATGVEIKDFDKGLVGFPTFECGRGVDYVWQYGEEGIERYFESGVMTGRGKQISELETAFIGGT